MGDMRPLDFLSAASIAAAALGLSYAMALMGEPQSAWFWCAMAGAC